MRLLAVALLVQPRVLVGGRFMGVVGALLAVEVGTVAVAAIGTILGAEALMGRPGLDQRAVHGEVIVAHEPLRLLQNRGEELLRHLARQQAVAVLREHRVVPHRRIRTHDFHRVKPSTTSITMTYKTLAASKVLVSHE